MDLACPRGTLSTRSSLPSRVRGVLMNAMLAPSLFALPSALRLRVVRRPRPRYHHRAEPPAPNLRALDADRVGMLPGVGSTLGVAATEFASPSPSRARCWPTRAAYPSAAHKSPALDSRTPAPKWLAGCPSPALSSMSAPRTRALRRTGVSAHAYGGRGASVAYFYFQLPHAPSSTGMTCLHARSSAPVEDTQVTRRTPNTSPTIYNTYTPRGAPNPFSHAHHRITAHFASFASLASTTRAPPTDYRILDLHDSSVFCSSSLSEVFHALLSVWTSVFHSTRTSMGFE
ncbi:hypothetical protein DFH06DRAFT_1472940 [Mycena polygramma]|nr:hypothetical protein DFH06DRAFT_1472940 [Mycena polygramma]